MNKIKKMIVSIFIPKHTRFCHHRLRETKNGICGKPCIFWKDNGAWEHCRLLKQDLSVQDQIKDCNINMR